MKLMKNMINKLKCWWSGHIQFVGEEYKKLFEKGICTFEMRKQFGYCKRCNKTL